MSKLLIITQVYENYGAHDWDGEGECPQYWKAKGGSEYVVKNIDVNCAKELGQAAKSMLDTTSEYFTEMVIGWEVVEDDYLTEYEQRQLEYEGRIMFPAKELMV